MLPKILVLHPNPRNQEPEKPAGVPVGKYQALGHG